MNSGSWLECTWCGSRYELAPLFLGCPKCRQEGKRRPLEVQYEAARIAPCTCPGIWRWSSALPPVPKDVRLSLHEGNTPLVPLVTEQNGPRILLKNETANPTWSWKDRPNAVSVSVAKMFGFERALTKSTGNQGNSMAAYASAAGLSATVFCNEDTPLLQRTLMQAYGARVVQTADANRIVQAMIEEQGFFPCTILCPQAGFSNPYGIEGFKTIAFEIVEALGGRAPDRVFVGTGSGDGTYGLWKGFRELHGRGQIVGPPKMIGCQAEEANSAFLAWQKGRQHVEPIASLNTIARSVAEAATGDDALRAIYESQGAFMQASDEEIAAASPKLMRKGFALEAASVLPFACAERERKLVNADEVWVVIGSGSAVKWPEALIAEHNTAPTREALSRRT